MSRLLGKREARADPRMMSLPAVLDMSTLPPPPKWANWRASMPDGGIPMLGNDALGLCVWATIFHYLQIAAEYTLQPLPSVPTTDECVAAYSAGTGYNPADPLTDRGTYVLGRGGAVEYWTKHGVTCGGVLNHLTSAVTVDFTNPALMKHALVLGPVMVGATMTESDVDAYYMWEDHHGRVLGGHEFLVLGYETLLSGKVYYDVASWNGLFRFTDDWMQLAVDEVIMVLDDAFFNVAGIDPAGLNKTALTAAMNRVAGR